MKNRRSLTQSDGLDPDGVHAMRRAGARREVSERVTLQPVSAAGGGAAVEPLEAIEGWALNVSRGGVRVILEGKVALGQEYEVTVGDAEKGGTSARGRIVWMQEEPDGAIVGIEFVGASATPPPPAAADKLSE